MLTTSSVLATGCSELIFNPLVEWLTKGPINPQLHTFLWCSAPVHYKVSMTSYMFSYCTSVFLSSGSCLSAPRSRFAKFR